MPEIDYVLAGSHLSVRFAKCSDPQLIVAIASKTSSGAICVRDHVHSIMSSPDKMT